MVSQDPQGNRVQATVNINKFQLLTKDNIRTLIPKDVDGAKLECRFFMVGRTSLRSCMNRRNRWVMLS
nr:hypothetical protein [Tanacetum cinerariifolium]